MNKIYEFSRRVEYGGKNTFTHDEGVTTVYGPNKSKFSVYENGNIDIFYENENKTKIRELYKSTGEVESVEPVMINRKTVFGIEKNFDFVQNEAILKFVFLNYRYELQNEGNNYIWQTENNILKKIAYNVFLNKDLKNINEKNCLDITAGKLIADSIRCGAKEIIINADGIVLGQLTEESLDYRYMFEGSDSYFKQSQSSALESLKDFDKK